MTQDKLKLFISHAKRDGLVVAENLRNSLRSKTKLDSFFDKNDIIEGVDFEKQIKENVKSSLLMVLDSDAYGTRQWCQKEILCAKKYGVPIVVVDMHSDVITRTFPYMGNVPSVRLNDDNLDSAINLLLRTGLRYEYQKNYLTRIVKEGNDDDDFDILSYQPELLDMHMLEKKMCFTLSLLLVKKKGGFLIVRKRISSHHWKRKVCSWMENLYLYLSLIQMKIVQTRLC